MISPEQPNDFRKRLCQGSREWIGPLPSVAVKSLVYNTRHSFDIEFSLKETFDPLCMADRVVQNFLVVYENHVEIRIPVNPMFYLPQMFVKEKHHLSVITGAGWSTSSNQHFVLRSNHL